MRVAVDQCRHQKLAARVDDFLVGGAGRRGTACRTLCVLIAGPNREEGLAQSEALRSAMTGWLPIRRAALCASRSFVDTSDGAVGKNLHRSGIQDAVGGIECEHASVAN